MQPVGLVERPQDGRGLPARVRVLEHRLERSAAGERAAGSRTRACRYASIAAGHVRQPLLPYLAQASQERELVRGRLREREVGLQRVGEVLPAVGQLVERRERRERRPVRAEVVDDACGTRGWPRSRRSACRPASSRCARSNVRRASLVVAERSRARRTSTSSRHACVFSYRRSSAESAAASPDRPRAARAMPRSRRADRRAPSRTARRAGHAARAAPTRRPRASPRCGGCRRAAGCPRRQRKCARGPGRRAARWPRRPERAAGSGDKRRLRATDVVELVLVEARHVHQDLGARERARAPRPPSR